MDLPASVTALGDQLRGAADIAADPALFGDADVFAAERERIFSRPLMAVDHETRLAADAHFFRCDAASRSVIVTREGGGRLHALRNVCIHAGYPVCDAEEGPAERLICPYHGWEFAADGRLIEPDLSRRIDPARLRLANHPVCVRDGLIFVDPSRTASGSEETDAAPIAPGALPGWLAAGNVTNRARYSTDWNWKLALQFVRSSPHLFCDDPGEDGFIGFGPLSLMLVEPHQAVLLRVIPKSAAHTDIQLVRMAPPETPATNGRDHVAEGLREAGDAETVARTANLDRDFFGWYWSLMSPG